MLPKKEKYKKGLFPFFNKNKEKVGSRINNFSEEKVNNNNSVESGKIFIPKTQESIPSKSSEKKNISIKTILLIGSTGKGKSTLANVLVNETRKDGRFKNFQEIFKESNYCISETREIKHKRFKSDGIEYGVIDTVGISDTKLKKEEVLDKIAEAVYLAKDGISQVFFVISKKFDQKEMVNYDLLKTIIFDDEVVKHTTIIRTFFGDFKDQEKCQNDIELMIKKGGKLKEIIEHCREKIVYVNNPSLNLVPADNENEETRIKREGKIEKGKEARSDSREILLEHLKQVCQKNPYIPEKLNKLSAEITDYMEKKIESKRKLAEKERKRLEDKKKEQEKLKSINIQNSKVEDNKIRVISKEKDKEEQTSNNQDFKKSRRTNQRIKKLREEIKELKEVKKLKEEIEEKEKAIRRKILEHIFNNYNDITKVIGGSNFIESIVGDNVDLSKVENKDYNFNELLSQWKELEKNSEDKEDLMFLLIEEIETEIKKKEEKIVESNRELLKDKEIVEKWQSHGFDIQQIREWADILGSDFNPKKDVSFYTWLRDNKNLAIEKEKILNYNRVSIEKLRNEYEQLKNQAQEWLEAYFPVNGKSKYKDVNCLNKKRNEITKLIISSERLTGTLDLIGFDNLEILDCSDNELTKYNFLTQLSPINLRKLNISDNNLSMSDLSVFSSFVNLEYLSVGSANLDKIEQGVYNRWIGSLEPLKSLTKLKFLDIDNTDIDSGLEFLSNFLENFYCSTREIPESLVRNLVNKLSIYVQPNDDNYASLLIAWKNTPMWKKIGFTEQEIKQWTRLGLGFAEYKVLSAGLRTLKVMNFNSKFAIGWFNNYKKLSKTESLNNSEISEESIEKLFNQIEEMLGEEEYEKKVEVPTKNN